MVNRRLKQILAIIVALAFVGSILFFIPKVPNNSEVSYQILIPNSLINSSYLDSFSSATFSNLNVSSLGGASGTVDNVIADTNATNLLSLTNFVLNSSKLNYNESGGNIACVISTKFNQTLCNNDNYKWLLFSGTGSSVSLDSGAKLSSISLNSVQNGTNFILIYYNTQTSTSSKTNSTPIPPVFR